MPRICQRWRIHCEDGGKEPMITAERILLIANQEDLLIIRDSTRATIGDVLFRSKVEEFRPIVAEIGESRKCSAFDVLISIAQSQHDDMKRMLAVACCYELISPSLEPVQ